MTIEVRAARQDDIGALCTTLGRAFRDDPVMSWLFPDATKRVWRLTHLFTALTRNHHFANGAVEVAVKDGAVGAATLWDPPGRWQHSPLAQVRALPRLLLAFGPRALSGLEILTAVKKVHPARPHWYLAVIGSDPAMRGGGLAHALMHSRLDRCDGERSGAYLESSNPANLPYYERFGFEVVGEIAMPHGAPPIWPMWREPR